MAPLNAIIDLEAEVEIPVFTTGLECDMLGYIVVAAIAHLGQDRSGHCRALLKIQPGVTTAAQPIAWLLTDDEQKPAPVWQIPTWFQTHATVVWAVRTDCLRLPLYQPESGTSSEPSNTKDASHVDPVTTPETALIHLLQAQPGVGTEERRTLQNQSAQGWTRSFIFPINLNFSPFLQRFMRPQSFH